MDDAAAKLSVPASLGSRPCVKAVVNGPEVIRCLRSKATRVRNGTERLERVFSFRVEAGNGRVDGLSGLDARPQG